MGPGGMMGPGAMMGPPPGPLPEGSLTPEQQAVVQLVLEDPVLLRAIIQQAGLMPQGTMAPEGRGMLKALAPQDEPITEDSAKMEKRLLGSARRGK